MNVVDAHLLDGQPLLAVQAARALLEEAEDPDAREALVRALVELVRPMDAQRALEGLPDDRVLGRALVDLALGSPSRARLRLLDARPAGDLAELTLAELHLACGDAAAAVGLAGRLLERVRGRDPRWEGLAERTFGQALDHAGDDRAEVVLRRALATFEEVCPETVHVAATLDALGRHARRANRPAEALVHHQRALELWTDVLGEDAGNTGVCRYALAQAHHRTGDFAEALAHMQAAFLVTRRTLGNDHLDTWITRFELGRMEVDVGEMLDGFPRMEAARAEVARRLGAQHPIVRSMDRWL